MDLIIIIINQKHVRKKVTNYLEGIGYEDFITMKSRGTFSMLTRGNEVRRSIDTIFDDKIETVNKNEVIGFINKDHGATKKLIDTVHSIIHEDGKSFDTGIAFSISISNELSLEGNL